ncbi:YcgN family cysteine cluster protein [Mangrovicella endophytica]|uniref:YcgN family cysteine cluster protein n=1 Tax=Mangrovicella endophytica TaxID=2066697 RepID=UPI000C9DBA93|nr:YcgN family cysteine cluster protein [Mangrovicella endophytica]
MRDTSNTDFWRHKRLEQMTPTEWEQVCDGCGRCCLNKLEDWDTGEIAWTRVRCRLLNDQTCRCSNYPERQTIVPECLPLDATAVHELTWLPPTCGYRLLAEGRELYWWHHLVSGDPDTVHQAGISVRGRTVSEEGMPLEELEDHLADWPGEDPHRD